MSTLPTDRRAPVTTPAKARRAERLMMPRPWNPADSPPERACAVMAAELEALTEDIAAARRRARRRNEAALGPARRPVAAPDGERIRLARRRQIAVRPVRASDANALGATFGRLGALTRYRRFLTTLHHLTPQQIAYLTRVDHVDHEALVALDTRTGDIVGVARYVREPGERSCARVAAVVADDWQGRGVGSALNDRLGARARANGIQTLRGATASGNEAVRRLVQRAGGTHVEDPNTATLRVSLRLGDVPPVPVPLDRPERRRPTAQPALAYAAAR